MLPPLPSFLPSKPADALAPDTTIYPDIPEAGPSNASTCVICSSPFKYTCPRCSARTCSLPCIKTHKSNTGCSGQRDPTKFVTLTEFGQSDWGGDYAYLENGRRRVADWGKDLPVQSNDNSSRGGRGGHWRGGGGGHGGGKRGPSKVDGLKEELERRGVEVEFMPEGMGRRKLNQSSWNQKYVLILLKSCLRCESGVKLIFRTQALYLTIQLQIPQNLLDGQPSTSSTAESKTINHLRILYAHPTQDLPTLSSLLPASIPPSEIVTLLPFHPSYSNPTPIEILLRQPRPKLFFPPLDIDKPLEDVFRGMSWVEFPVLKIMLKVDWERELGEGRVAIVPVAKDIGKVEKRVIDDGWAGRKKMKLDVDVDTVEGPVGVVEEIQAVPAGLAGLGDYLSDDDEVLDQDEEVTEDDIKLMRTLGAAAAADMV